MDCRRGSAAGRAARRIPEGHEPKASFGRPAGSRNFRATLPLPTQFPPAIDPVLFHYSIDTLPQHVAANPAPLHAQDFTLG